ncbi:MAG: protein kinase [Verrucomicrobiaceae bacterium]|nr:protein kinase [Verrucomicrobiaceae bacterium]
MSDSPKPLPDPDATLPVTGPAVPTHREGVPSIPLPEELGALLPQGDYIVLSFLGQGGMGAVYKGTQVRLQRPVAIKIMKRDQGRDHGFEERFRREALAMAKLNHPNIVSVIDYGEAGPDYLYIVMELVDGADLMEVIRTNRMTQEMALTLLPQICDALQFAHDHGIVHRDIKPSNIMLTREGRIKMADFGLAKHFDVKNGFQTQTGSGMGTPDYAAPEQFDPSAEIDHRADIYALGVMIYQMITGQLPRGVWKPPSQRADVHPQWDDIVGQAMQSNPEDRYQKASEVKSAVSGIALSSRVRKDVEAEDEKGAYRPAGHTLASGATRPRAALVFGLVMGVAIIALGMFFGLRKRDQSGPLNRSEASVAKALELAGGTVLHPFDSARQESQVPPSGPLTRMDAIAGLLKLGALIRVNNPHLSGQTQVISEISQLPAPFIVSEIALSALRTHRPILDSDFELLALLPEVHVLSLAHQKAFTSKGIEQLRVLRQINNIQFTGTKVNDSCLKIITALPSLCVLNFDNTMITDQGVAELNSRQDYISLDFTNCDITDAAAKTLASFKRLKQLRLGRTKVTATAIQMLRAALPDCNIFTVGQGAALE